MAFGVTPTGFVLKRQEDIEAEVTQDLINAFGQIDTDPDSVFGQLIGVLCFQMAQEWEQMESVYNSEYPSSAEGTSLDGAASYIGLTRLPASQSSCVVELKGAEGTVVPAGTQIAQGLTGYLFDTQSDVTITEAALHKTILAVTVAASTTYNFTINGQAIAVTSDSGNPSVDQVYNQIMFAILAYPALAAALYVQHNSGDAFLTIQNKSLVVADTFSISVGADLTLSEIWCPAATLCETSAAYPVPVGSLNIIASPISGLTAVTNLVDGVTGRHVETDTAFRIRRRNSLKITGAATLSSILSRVLQDVPEVTQAFIYENATGSTDSFGRPGHSFELIVAALNTSTINQKIANKIWERKPAGILAYGQTVMNVIDSNGNNQPIGFSHAAPKYAWVRLSCSTSGSDQVFPVTGRDIIKSAIMTLGAGLTFGNDLLLQPFAACGYAAGGITSVTCELAITDDPAGSPVYAMTNIVISANNYATFDLSRIVVNIL